MTDYDKLVAALRYHADTTNCDACKLYDAGKCELKSCVLHDAADAIEALDAKADYWMGQAQEEYEKRLRQMPKRGVKKNADIIRAMTDEELAEWVTSEGRYFGEEYEGYMSCLDWLQEEVQDG